MILNLPLDQTQSDAMFQKRNVGLLRRLLKVIPRVAWLICLLLLLPAVSSLSHASETSPPLAKEHLNVGFLQNSFSGVNYLDAEAALKTFARTLAVAYGYEAEVTVRRFANVREIESMPSAGRIDLILLDTWSYLEMKAVDWIEPAFVSCDQDQLASHYLLLARRNGNFKSLNDLQGKSLNLYTASNALLGIPWLETLLQVHKLGKPEAFFGRLEYHTDPMSAVLQVFFGKKDAALVDSSTFELMAEMNPQINRLRTIESSEPLVNYVICLKRSGWSSVQFRRDVTQALAELHLKPAGQQVLTIFKFGRIVPFENNQLDTVRKLHEMAMSRRNKAPGVPGSRP